MLSKDQREHIFHGISTQHNVLIGAVHRFACIDDIANIGLPYAQKAGTLVPKGSIHGLVLARIITTTNIIIREEKERHKYLTSCFFYEHIQEDS